MLAANIVISEILPNPVGNDQTGEWIELSNLGNEAVSLAGWQLDDIEGGSRPYSFPDATVLASGEYLIFPREVTKIALNNSGTEQVRLFNDAGQLVDSLEFADLGEATALARDTEGTYRITKNITPAAVNKFDLKKLIGKVRVISPEEFTVQTANDLVSVKFGTKSIGQVAQTVMPTSDEWEVFVQETDEVLTLTDFTLPADSNLKAQSIPNNPESGMTLLLLSVAIFLSALAVFYYWLRGRFAKDHTI